MNLCELNIFVKTFEIRIFDKGPAFFRLHVRKRRPLWKASYRHEAFETLQKCNHPQCDNFWGLNRKHTLSIFNLILENIVVDRSRNIVNKALAIFLPTRKIYFKIIIADSGSKFIAKKLNVYFCINKHGIFSVVHLVLKLQSHWVRLS